jgi:hypothetical protein
VPRDERRDGLNGPITVGGVQVGMTDPGCGDFHQDLSRSWCWDRNVLDPERAAEAVHDGRFHQIRH